MEITRKSVRVFENPFLERLSRVHPVTPILLWIPIISVMIYQALVIDQLSAGTIMKVGAVGFFIWTLAEYMLHRFIFHFNAVGSFQERIQFMIHGMHHADPVDFTRLVMPPAPAIIMAIIFHFIFKLFLGPVLVGPCFAFFAIGYLCYDYTHFSIHYFEPKSKIGRWMKQYHMLHHYADQNSRWGVSNPFWDFVFGTTKTSKIPK